MKNSNHKGKGILLILICVLFVKTAAAQCYVSFYDPGDTAARIRCQLTIVNMSDVVVYNQRSLNGRFKIPPQVQNMECEMKFSFTGDTRPYLSPNPDEILCPLGCVKRVRLRKK